MTEFFIMDGFSKKRFFDLEGDTIHIGRSSDNDVQIKDSSVSRRHLEIIKKENRYFIKDLRSTNGTFVNGEQIGSDMEIEVEQGIPIVIGMSVICLGQGCSEEVESFLDSMDVSKVINENDVERVQDRPMTRQKDKELIHKVSNVFMEASDIKETLEKILDYILNHLKRIDRGVIILIDNKTGEISEVMSRLRKPEDDTSIMFSRPVVDRVIKEGKAVIISDVDREDVGKLSDTLKLLKIGSVMCVPLFIRSKIRGVIYVDSMKTPYGFRKEDASLFRSLSGPAAIAIENALMLSREDSQ